jgi:hypothetical protein
MSLIEWTFLRASLTSLKSSLYPPIHRKILEEANKCLFKAIIKYSPLIVMNKTRQPTLYLEKNWEASPHPGKRAEWERVKENNMRKDIIAPSQRIGEFSTKSRNGKWLLSGNLNKLSSRLSYTNRISKNDKSKNL